MKVIAHRGASAHAPENTVASFQRALEMGATAIEFDVQQTKDGRLVVIHDLTLERFGGSGRRVPEMEWNELSQVDVGRLFDTRFSGERIPLLEQTLNLLVGRVELFLEIKTWDFPCPGIEAKVLREIVSRRCTDSVTVSSKDRAALFKIRELRPDLRLGYIFGGTSTQIFSTVLKETSQLKAASLDINRTRLSPSRLRAAKERGLEVLVYTVNELSEMRDFEKMGVDGIFSNHPELAHPVPAKENRP